MKFVGIILAVLCLFLFANARYSPKKKVAPSKPAEEIKVNIDALPNLLDVLDELSLSHFLKQFVKAGVTETRNLIRLKDMDFRLMKYDWDGITDEDIERLKLKINSIIEDAKVIEIPPRADLIEREKLKYGRVYLDNCVQNFEYKLASFGGTPPLNSLPLLMMEEPSDGCEVSSELDFTGFAVVIKRGNCSFLVKARNAFHGNASALVIVNTDDRIESPASGLGIDLSVNESDVLQLDHLPIISVSNSSWAKFQHSIKISPKTPHIHIVPLKCGTTGICNAVTPEEQHLSAEITWGNLQFGDKDSAVQSQSCEFLTSNFGGSLPTEQTLSPVVLAQPLDACKPIQPLSSDGKSPSWVLVSRGQCRFDVKARHVEQAGGQFMIVMQSTDESLQRMGGQSPEVTEVGIPSILISQPCGQSLLTALHHATPLPKAIQASLLYGNGHQVFQDWVDIAYTEWESSPSDHLIQLQALIRKYEHHEELVQWMERRIQDLQRRTSSSSSSHSREEEEDKDKEKEKEIEKEKEEL